ncbi:ATP-binding protein [Streptomyces sp. FXJ1.172]|uniref:sensor histidine kinase n=1 Tax=Streptomyces sp. FXJ1.172 TaxID=710705 RepID=UPI0007CF95DA
MPADIDLAAYRIVQEALTNVVRHAGTGHCRATVGYGDEELSMEVVDDGRGAFGPGPGHSFGIIGMRDAGCGSGPGCCTAGSAPGRGPGAVSGWWHGYPFPRPRQPRGRAGER